MVKFSQPMVKNKCEEQQGEFVHRSHIKVIRRRKKDGDWYIYQEPLAHVQKHSETFKPSVDSFESTWTKTAKNVAFLVPNILY